MYQDINTPINMETKKKLRPIEFARIAVTPYCDLRCKHCYASDVSLDQLIGFEEDQMSVKEIKHLIDDLRTKENLKKISMTGGEILTERVWERTKEILDYALQHDLIVQMNTSGSDTISVSDILEVAGSHFKNIVFHVSLDGVTAETVDEFRGRKGAFSRSIRFIRDAIALGGYVEVRFTITSTNHDVATDCYKMMSKMGASCFVAKVVFPTGSVYKHSELLTTTNIFAQVQKDLISSSVDNPTNLMLPSPIFINIDNLPAAANCTITECSCGDTTIYVSYDGNVLPCPYLQGSEYYEKLCIGNVTDPAFNLHEAWASPRTFRAYRNAGSYKCATYMIMAGEIDAE